MKEKHARLINKRIDAFRSAFENFGKQAKEYRVQRCESGKEVTETYNQTAFSIKEAVDALNAYQSEYDICLHSIEMYETAIGNLHLLIELLETYVREEEKEKEELDQILPVFIKKLEEFAKEQGGKLMRESETEA